MTDVAVRSNPAASAYDAFLGDRLVGSLRYEVVGTRAVISHTIVDPEHRGRGIAAVLVRSALDDLGVRGLTITIHCSFVTEFIGAHPEYGALVDPRDPGAA